MLLARPNQTSNIGLLRQHSATLFWQGGLVALQIALNRGPKGIALHIGLLQIRELPFTGY
jgi:hypothetical protein